MTKVFFDTEFTGLHQGTTLISIGLVADNDKAFYAELTDYDPLQINDWLRKNVLANLTLEAALQGRPRGVSALKTVVRGDKALVAAELKTWLALFGPVQMWSDCLAYDWVLLNALLADYTNGYPQLPAQVHYIPMDICTLFQVKGIDPDVSREEYMGVPNRAGDKHNALWDAQVIKACYEKLTA